MLEGLALQVFGLSAVVAILILTGTIFLIAWRPRGMREGVAASIGAALMIGAGWATPVDVWQTVQSTGRIMVFLVAMMVIATVADEAGFFDWTATWAVRMSQGHGRRLYVYLYLLGAVITLFLSLDVTAIIFTPIVCASALRLRLKPGPFVFASAFVANTASLALPVSNLTNMLVYDLLGIDFWSFVRYMALPNLAALAVNLGVFLVLFRGDIRGRFVQGAPIRAEGSRRFLKVAGTGMGLVVLALLAAGFLGWPLYAVALAGALALAAAGLLGRQVSVGTLRRGVAWQLPLFVVGMYVVITGANRAALAPLWNGLLRISAEQPDIGVVLLAFGTGIGSNLVNNIPMSMVAITALKSAPGPSELLSFATVIGTNLGPNVTVFGSLATMLVLSTARKYGIEISAGQYLRVGLLTTPLMLVTASTLLLALARTC